MSILLLGRYDDTDDDENNVLCIMSCHITSRHVELYHDGHPSHLPVDQLVGSVVVVAFISTTTSRHHSFSHSNSTARE